MEWLIHSEAGMKSYVLAFVIGGSILSLWLASVRWVEANYKKQVTASPGLEQSSEAPHQDGTQQRSEGANSPNIIGNNNTVIITAPPAQHPPKKGEKTSDIAEGGLLGGGFQEADTALIHVRVGGYDKSHRKEWLKKGNVMQPLLVGPEHYAPISVGMDKNGKLLLNCELIGGDESNPFRIKILNNVFDVASGFVQKNYNDVALEIADDSGVPLFQVIRVSKNQLTINGIFMTGMIAGGKPVRVWAWEDKYAIDVDRPSDFALKPIFKYPSWKYLGKYAD